MLPTFVTAYGETFCDNYQSCVDLFSNEKDVTMVRMFYNKSTKTNKFNVLNDYIIKIENEGCPLKFNVYSKDYSINKLLDTFKYSSDNEDCVTYVTNLTGSGVDSANIVGQLEMKYCPKDTDLNNYCERGIIVAKVIDFRNQDQDMLDKEQKAQQDKDELDALKRERMIQDFQNQGEVLPPDNEFLRSKRQAGPDNTIDFDFQKSNISGYSANQ